jgi:hypothetical protein
VKAKLIVHTHDQLLTRRAELLEQRRQVVNLPTLEEIEDELADVRYLLGDSDED